MTKKMKRCAWPRRVLLSLLLCHATSFAAVEAIDAAGNKVRLENPARRIVSLAPHVTEMLFAAGSGSRVIGVVSYSDFPPAAARIARVGDYDNFDIERIVLAKPDLVVAWQSGNSSAQVSRLKELGLAVYLSEPRSIEDVPRDIERLGQLAGTSPVAQLAAASFRERHARLRKKYADRPAVKVFYQIWNQPLMTVNGAHLISQVIRLCGGHNVFSDLPILAAMVDVEAVLKADPGAIVAGGMGEDNPAWLDDWRRYPSLFAVRADNLFFIPPSLLQRNGPRILDGAERMCQTLDRARARRNPGNH